MNRGEKETTTIYKVVVNHEEQYSIWPAASENPLGWRDVSKTGLKNECLAYINEAWTDMRPLSLRKKMEEISHGGKDTHLDNPNGVCIHQLFEAQAERTPNSVAVVFEDQQLTYRELNQRANQLAHHLQLLDIGPEVMVGLCVDRSVEMVVGLLGILKAGGVYVPLDPAYPNQRLASMFQDAQLSILLTQERLQKGLFGCGAQLICLDKDWHLVSQQSEENVNSGASPANLSHVIYTSGSTGMPKGVMVTHESLCYNVQAIREPLRITSDDVYLHAASIAFTSSLRQLLVPLSLGATVVITTPEQRTNPLALFDLIKRKGATIMDTVASFWENCTHLLARLEPHLRDDLLKNKLRLILSSGGELPSGVPREWSSELQHGAELVNMYGQTETIGNILVYPIPIHMDDDLRLVPLGPAIAHTQVYLLDKHMQPVPSGIPAELHIGGLSLARGYLNRPDLTADKFVPNPFSAEPGVRLYRTGDRGRLLSNGSIEFLGRIDLQINIRGFRIEPAEIETLLRQNPGVWETVVVAREDLSGNKRLIAYLVSDSTNAPTIRELRSLLTDRLPAYMVPSAFVRLDALPRLPNGKINRQALPAPEQTRPDLQRPYVAPRSELQRYLSDLWCELLELDGIGIQDRFFELGGTSILAARFVNRVQEELGEVIPVISFFEAPSIAEYSVFLKKHYAQAVARRFRHELGSDYRLQAGKVEPEYPTKIRSSTVLKSRRELGERQRQLRFAHRESK